MNCSQNLTGPGECISIHLSYSTVPTRAIDGIAVDLAFAAAGVSSLRTVDVNVDSIAHSPDQQELVTYDGATIKVLNLADFSVARSLTFHSPSDYSNVVFAPDGRHVVIGTGSRLASFTWPTLEKSWELDAPAHFVTFNPDGDQIWIADHGSARAPHCRRDRDAIE
mgnify:CR=1 FL=1